MARESAPVPTSALYKMNGGYTGAFASQKLGRDSEMATDLPRVDAPKGKAPDPRDK